MTDQIRKALVEDASRIEVTPVTWDQVARGSEFGKQSGARGKKKRHTGLYGLGAAACLVVVFGASGFVSPAMAATLHKIPVIGALYSFNVPQMNQYSTTNDVSATDQGITISVPRAYYDGNQLDITYEIQVPSGYQSLAGSQVRPPSEINLNGRAVSFESVQGDDSAVSSNIYSGKMEWNLSSHQFPQSGTLTIPIHQVGSVQGNWMLSIPVSSIAVTNASQSKTLTGVSSSAYGITLTATKVSQGPAFTTISMEMRQPLQANGHPKYEMSDRTFEFGTASNITGGISFVGSVPDEKVVGNEAVWDFTLQVQTPPSNVKSIPVEPVWFGSTPGPVPYSGSGFLPHLSQLNVTVPIN
ncbi:protein of unknown function [Alicyclobacillus hesperidum]|uniref:DUF4179 domain-containing protein n=1 Tax=Alicyclobacillus hesperidum TaxID=89784 RepID=A0A1H2YHS7_9BACL|nr:DUF4179 domain-containing protein [Alicyclobacillus hesperidum]SDX04174.1 protein of unknown function [Alicyclobacillus hesperidum]